jgi:hypothetical protein
MENNNYPGQIPGQGQQIGTGEGESPIIKSTIPNMDVRTMASDMQSVSSGSAPKPYAPQTTTPANVPPRTPSPITPPPDQSFQIPQTDVLENQSGEPTPKKSSKGIFTALIVFIVVVGLAALGYFVIYPIFFAAPATPVPAVPAPEPTPTPSPEPAPTPTPEPTSTAPVIPAPVHASLFTTPADSQIETSVVTNGSALSGLTLNTTASPSLTEIVYKGSDGTLIKFGGILNEVLRLDISSNPALASAFNDLTATGLVYGDGSARWLGFAVQLSAGANASAAFQQAFEAVASYGNLFASDPGTAQIWKDGQITGVTGNRYLLFSKSGFAVDYGWVGNKLVIMTSYDGFKDAVNRLK